MSLRTLFNKMFDLTALLYVLYVDRTIANAGRPWPQNIHYSPFSTTQVVYNIG
jgi:hypothetical protein